MAEIHKINEREEEMIARELFVHVVSMFASSAMQNLGKIPNPATGQPEHNLEGAQTMIAMLEMLQTKTKNNLSPEEKHLLDNAVSSLQMTFVEELEILKTKGKLDSDPTLVQLDEKGDEKTVVADTKQEKPAAPAPPSASAANSKPSKPSEPTKPTDEGRKRFTKKYE